MVVKSKKIIEIKKETYLISLILMLSAVLNFANIGIEGYSNIFYAAGVKSMMMNFKNFYFASFDPAGFVTVDKPPVGLWIQTISAKILGFSGWSIILPQALAGVISVWIIYYLVKRSFGSCSGLISALCLSITPIFVASSRNNTIDNLLVLSLLLACWALLIAAEKGNLKYLILSLVLVGIGFNIKMVEAYMVAPALYITYLFSYVLPVKKKIKHLVLGSVILLVVSLSWAVMTDLVPAGNRPFIGSSTNNTVIELMLGHNGLERIGIGGENNGSGPSQQELFNNGQLQKYAMGVTSKFSTISLFSKNNMSDQIGWLLPLALIGFAVAAIKEKLKVPFDNQRKLSLLLWSMWLLPEFIYFSFSSNVMHTYYLTTMAPSIAALVGIGFITMWQLFKQGGWKIWILPTALIVNGLVEIEILSYNYGLSNGYKILIIIGLLGILFSILLAIVNTNRSTNNSPDRGNTKLNKILISFAFIGLLTAPTVWSFTPMFHPMDASNPSAGLELFSSKQGENSITNSSNVKLIKFLTTNMKNEKYMVEVPSSLIYGSALILQTGEPILTLGGFRGSDPILTLDQFKQLVSDGALRYAMVSEDMGSNSNIAIMNWIKANGKAVQDSEWRDYINLNTQIKNQGFGRFGGSGVLINSNKLYDLRPTK